MKLVCTQSDLSTHLALVSRVVPSRPTHPVLANVLLSADLETQIVRLTAFDLSLGIQTTFSAQVEAEGNLTLPAKLLNDIVSRLPAGDIILDATGDESVVTLVSSSGRYQVRGMGAEEFPDLPVLESEDAAHLSPEALIEGLSSSLFATSTDESKQVLTGVHVTTQPDGLEFAATDGHRLAVVQTVDVADADVDADADAEKVETRSNTDLDLSVTVPARALRELKSMLGMKQSADLIALQMDRGQAIFEWANQRLTSRLLEGQYPNYRQLIPRQFARQATVDRKLFASALERIAVIADQKNNIVKLNFDATTQALALSVDAQDVGSGQETIPVQLSGDSLEVAFNVKYLLDGLKVINTADIKIQLNTSTSPAILEPLGNLKMTYLVMPVQIRS